jgi:hypothetical protein
VVHRTAYFPGWVVRVNDQPVEIDSTDERYPGLISYRVEPGSYQVKASFTQATWPRRLGNSLTALGIASLIYVGVRRGRKAD